MKKHVLSILALLLFTFAVNPGLTYASHSTAADLTYKCLGGNQYQLTLKFYRDCSGVAAPSSVTVRYQSTSLSSSASAVLYPIPGTGDTLQNSKCVVQTGFSCSVSNLYHYIIEWIYQGTVTLPGAASDWIFSYELCCRNPNNVLQNPTSESIYVSAFLDNVTAPCNSSPVFSTQPVPFFCVGNLFYYNQQATDADGDSLVFSLVDAQTSSGALISYVSPYSATYPLATNPPNGVVIDPATGIITFKPSAQMISVICVLVKEYRNGVLIGSVKRDMQAIITPNCINVPIDYVQDTTVVPSKALALHGLCGDSVIHVKFTNPFQCGSVSLDGTDFRMLDPDGNAIPIIEAKGFNCLGGLSSELTLTTFFPLCKNGTYHIWSKMGNDLQTLLGECGTTMVQFDSVEYIISDCFTGAPDNKNVTVVINDYINVIWAKPAGLDQSKFQEWQIFRSTNPWGPDTLIGKTFAFNDTTFNDTTAEVHVRPYYYRINVMLNACANFFSDSIASIYLFETPQGDTTKSDLTWTPYIGWSGPEYSVMESKVPDTTTWKPVGTTTNTFYSYQHPAVEGQYLLKVQTENTSGTNYFKSESNWLRLDVIVKDILPPNIFTPNRDGHNDNFEVINLEQYPHSHIRIYNRWGTKIYENEDYQNNWDGGKMSDGVYYYILNLWDGTSRHGTVTLLRNQ